MKRSLLRACLCLALTLAFFCLSGKLLEAQNISFQDLPADHWAFGDIDFLVKKGYMEGYPDGTFKGRKVTTRYDLALILARVLKRMEERKETLESATEAERAALSRLTKEFRDELGLLGVRIDSLERRMTDAESSIKDLEGKLPKVKISGFYRGRAQYVMDTETIGRKGWGYGEASDFWWYPYSSYSSPGLTNFYQQVYLRFTGRPMGERVEAFFEIYGFIQGATYNRLVYNTTGKDYGANPFDNIDDYVTSVKNDRFVIANRLHFVSKAKSMRVRIYANEAVNGVDNPTNIFTEDTGIIDPFQGVELSGSDQNLSYQGGVYKTDWNYGSADTHEMISGRMVWKLPAKFSKDALTVGTSYAEKINDYKTRGNTNAVKAFDVNYTTERVGKVQATAEFLGSSDYHNDTSDNTSKELDDRGTRYDVSIQNGGFTGTVKHYDFGRDFRAMMAPVWAYDVGDNAYDNHPYGTADEDENYGHIGFYGEKLTRIAANYDFGSNLLSIAKNLSVEGSYLSKTWHVDPFKPQVTDGHSGRKYTFQLLSDFTDSTTLKYDFEQHLDARPDEEGTTKNSLELNLRLNDAVSTKGKIFVLTDHDDIDNSNGTEYKYNERVGYFEVNSNVNPRVFAKGSVEHQVRWANAPKENIRIDYIGETTYNLTPTTSLTGGIQHVDYEDRATSANSSLANAILAELKKNFTTKFRGRAFYSRAVIDYKDGKSDTIDRENIYGELIYDVSRDTTLRFIFGYDYPDEWRWAISSVDNGRDYEDVKTMKMLLFEARTTF